MTDLGTLGGLNSTVRAINSLGQVTGTITTPGSCPPSCVVVDHAFIYSGGLMMDLGTLGGTSSQGNAINDKGEVVGQSDTSGNAAVHAFLYSGGVMRDLGGSNSCMLTSPPTPCSAYQLDAIAEARIAAVPATSTWPLISTAALVVASVFLLRVTTQES